MTQRPPQRPLHRTQRRGHVIIDGNPVTTLPLSGGLAKGRRLILDREDYEWLKARYENPWRLADLGRDLHVVGNLRLVGAWYETGPRAKLKRLITGAVAGQSVHILNNNPCDLRRANLEVRPMTPINHPMPFIIRSANDRYAALRAALSGHALLVENVTGETLEALPWAHIGRYPDGNYDGLIREDVLTVLSLHETLIPVHVNVSLHVSWDRTWKNELFGMVSLAMTPEPDTNAPSYIIDSIKGNVVAFTIDTDGTLPNSGATITDDPSGTVGAALRAVGRDMLRRLNAALNEDEHMRKLNAFASQEAANV